MLKPSICEITVLGRKFRREEAQEQWIMIIIISIISVVNRCLYITTLSEMDYNILLLLLLLLFLLLLL